MHEDDIINGSIEFVGAFFVWMNVVKLWRDRQIRGVYWPTTAFFAVWGGWNLYYYPSLQQWFSFFGGMFIALGNLTWILLLIWVSWRKNVPS